MFEEEITVSYKAASWATFVTYLVYSCFVLMKDWGKKTYKNDKKCELELGEVDEDTKITHMKRDSIKR